MAKNTSKQKGCNEMRHKKLDLKWKNASICILKRKLVNAFIYAMLQNDANNKTIHKLHKLIFYLKLYNINA